ncbi:hypothetical protein LguiA_032432 [Lonicera macranthoides]
MSHRKGNGPKLELKLNLSPPGANRRVDSLGVVSPTSPPTSCLSSELMNLQEDKYSSSPETTSMMLVGCPRCLMYVMLSEEDPKCPKCKSTVLLDIHPYNNNNHHTAPPTITNNRTRRPYIS